MSVVAAEDPSPTQLHRSQSHVSSSGGGASPTRRRSSRSLFTNTALFEHLEDERAQEAAASPVKRKNPRVPDPEPKLVPPGTLSLTSMPPSCPSREPSPIANDDTSPRRSGRSSAIFITNGERSGLYASVPDATSIVRASLRILTDGDVTPPPTSGAHDDDGAIMQRCIRWLERDNDQAFLRWMRALGSLSSCLGETKVEGGPAGSTPREEVPQPCDKQADIRFIDLRWLPRLGTILDVYLRHKRGAHPVPSFHAEPPQLHAVPQSVVLTMPNGPDTWEQVTLAVLESGEMVLALGAEQQPAAPSAPPPKKRLDSECLPASPLSKSLTMWCGALLNSLPHPPDAAVNEAVGAIHDCLLRFLTTLLDRDGTSPRENLIVLLPLMGQRDKNQGLVAPINLLELLPIGTEGFALLSDGERAVYAVGGMQSLEVLACSSSVSSASPGAPLQLQSTASETAPFDFLRSAVKIDISACSSPTPLHARSVKPMDSKSLTVPGLAYHSVTLKNPPEGLRDTPTQAFAFGGFLNCVAKVPLASPGRNGGSSIIRSRSHSSSMSVLRRRPPISGRYGWVDCAIEGAAYNTVADSPVQIPGAYNGELIQQASRSRDARTRSDGTLLTAPLQQLPSWEVSNSEGAAPTLTCTNATFSFDLVSGLWKHIVTTGTVPAPRAHHAATMCGSWMVVVGGLTTDGVPCMDVVALHADQHVWVQLITGTTPSPLGPNPFLLTTPAELLMAPRPTAMDEEWAICFVSCDMTRLLRNAEARRRIEVAALKHQHEQQEQDGSSLVVLRSQRELDAILSRLTAADEASAQALEALKAKHQEAADRISGASSRLRTVRRPASQLELTTTRLMDRARPQRRLESALSWVDSRYDAPLRERTIKLTEKQLQDSIARMSDLAVDQWAKARASRLKNLERRQQEGRLPPSAIEMRRHDASYQPPAVSSEEICSRLAPQNYWKAKAEREEALLARIAQQSREQSHVQRHGKKNNEQPRSAVEVSQQLFENTVQRENRCKLFETYVVGPEASAPKPQP